MIIIIYLVVDLEEASGSVQGDKCIFLLLLYILYTSLEEFLKST